MTEHVIEARGLTKLYGDRKAVDGLNLAVEAGEVFGLLGPNGAGKTTTILMIMGLTDVTSGTVRVLGLDPAREPLAVKRRIGYMPDTVGFYDNLTARENLSYTGRLAGMDRTTIDRRVDIVLERVGLSDAADRKLATFSRGMRQRLGLADALFKEPRVVILDEPTSGLDPQATQEFLALIRDLKRDGITVLLSSHLLDRVQTICDRVALFHEGRVTLSGTISALAEQVLGGGHRILVEARGDGLEQALREIPGVTMVHREDEGRFTLEAEADVRPAVAVKINESGGDLYSLDIRQTSLDSIYTRYFEEVAHAA